MANRIYLLDEESGNISQCDLSQSGPISALPEALRTKIINAALDKPTLLAWSMAAETYVVSMPLQNMLCIFKRIRRMAFNAPFQIVSREMARILNPGSEANIPETQEFIMTPDLRAANATSGIQTQNFMWDVPSTMGLFLCTAVPGMSITTQDGVAAMLAAQENTARGTRDTGSYALSLIALDLNDSAISERRTIMYRPPFPNIHTSGELCCGAPAIAFNTLDVEGSFRRALAEWSSRTWNTDLFSAKDKEGLPQLMRGDPETGVTLPVTVDWRQFAERISDPLAARCRCEPGGPSVWFFNHYINAAALRTARGLSP